MILALDTPILFLIFNRPDLTEQVFQKIREQRPSRLYIAADGPRPDRAGEEEVCAASRAATEFIDWPCEVQRLYRSTNLGCKVAVSEAIGWLFKHEELGIILEDDCLPHPSFFRFCSEILERYRDDDRIGIVGGNNFQLTEHQKRARHSYYFSQYSHIWGWATWRRVWSQYNADLSDWSGDLEEYSERVPNQRVREAMADWMKKAQTGETNTWDYQLLFLMISQRLLAVTPWVNLVTNIGFDERATHTKSSFSNLPAAVAIGFPLAHPTEVAANRVADRYTEWGVFGIAVNLPTCLWRRTRSLLKIILFGWRQPKELSKESR
jgi:hypothetical protein